VLEGARVSLFLNITSASPRCQKALDVA
jgi:hypothetical protein